MVRLLKKFLLLFNFFTVTGFYRELILVPFNFKLLASQDLFRDTPRSLCLLQETPPFHQLWGRGMGVKWVGRRICETVNSRMSFPSRHSRSFRNCARNSSVDHQHSPSPQKLNCTLEGRSSGMGKCSSAFRGLPWSAANGQ